MKLKTFSEWLFCVAQSSLSSVCEDARHLDQIPVRQRRDCALNQILFSNASLASKDLRPRENKIIEIK